MTNSPIRKWTKERREIFIQEDTQMTDECMKRCTMLLAGREIWGHKEISLYPNSQNCEKTKKKTKKNNKKMPVPNAVEDGKMPNFSHIAGRNVKCYSYSGKEFGKFFYKTKHTVTTCPSNCTPSHLSWRNENLCLCRNLKMNVPSYFVHCSQNQK